MIHYSNNFQKKEEYRFIIVKDQLLSFQEPLMKRKSLP
jgi:hypothetical protein